MTAYAPSKSDTTTLTPTERAMNWERMSGERLSDAERKRIADGGEFTPPHLKTTDLLPELRQALEAGDGGMPGERLNVWAIREIEALRALVREMYGPACIYEGAACGDIGKSHPEVLARAVGAENV